MMLRFLLICLLLLSLILSTGSFAFSQVAGDRCQVSITDAAKAAKAVKAGLDDITNLPKDVIHLFPEFQTDIGEETETRRFYQFPRSRLFITAVVYYTDESLASASGADSMLVSLTVGKNKLRGALANENSSEAEVTYNLITDTVRVEKAVRVNGKQFLVSLTCHCNEERFKKGADEN